jgi:hypothetical protein
MELCVPHGGLLPLQRSIALLPLDFSPKGFYSERDKSGLEGMTQTLTMIRALEGAPARCSRKDRESTFSF